MPVPIRLLANFEQNGFYHVICKSIDCRDLFRCDDNRLFYLNQYHKLVSLVADTFAYSMLTNHAHFLIRTKAIREINQLLIKIPDSKLSPTQKRFLNANQTEMFHELVEQQFNRLFISYVRNYNKIADQEGHLFLRPFRRILVEDDAHLSHLVIYIHANPVKHNVTRNFATYPWSSYPLILSDNSTYIKRKEVLEWFGSRENFIAEHRDQIAYHYQHPNALE